jgi:hypothetical protein
MKNNLGLPSHFGATLEDGVSQVIREGFDLRNASRVRLTVSNTGNFPVFIHFGRTAVKAKGYWLNAGAAFTLGADDRYSGPISAIADGGQTTLSGVETFQQEL